ncbi:MAG: photosystem II assembly protein Psb34 [Prochlorothrix sp.]|nr:ssl1498 family light-harvesting-like protein [Prochlorothrix sp.]
MPYTVEDGGRINNFANEPRMQVVEPATNAQRRNYLVIAVATVVGTVGLITLVSVLSSGVA